MSYSNLSAKGQMFENRLVKVYKHRFKQAKKQNISCYRIYDHDLPEFPVAVDRYDRHLYVSEYRRKHHLTEAEYTDWKNEMLQIISKITATNLADIYIKERFKKENRLDQYQKTANEKTYFTVLEAGLTFKINLTDYLDTGLFLDHRITRELVRKESAEKRVLNLFAYTGSFSVYAAAGDALSVTTVDLSNTYLNWAKDNLTLNNFTDAQKYTCIADDAKKFIQNLTPDSYDLVILDPPTFSNSKKMKDDILDIQRDHVELINGILKGLSPNGVIYFSTNFTKFQLNTSAINACQIRDITKLTTPFDFDGKLKRYCWKILNS